MKSARPWPAFEAQSTSGEGMTPKKTVAAASAPAGTRIARQRVPGGGLAAAAEGGEPGATYAASAWGEPPAITGISSPGSEPGASGEGSIQTAATTRR